MQEDKSDSETQFTPGAVISPSVNASASPTEVNEEPSNFQAQPTAPVIGDDQSSTQPMVNETSAVDDGNISWTGPEFAQHDKSSSWYFMFVIAALIIGGGIYVATKDTISSVVVALAISVLGLYSLRKPKDIAYSLSDYGVTIGPKNFSYNEFRSFTVTVEGPYLTITFLPLRRFATTAGLFYQGNDEDKIVNFLADRLPMEKHKPDVIDSFMQRIRF